MADYGTLVARDAQQFPYGEFEHVMEPTAAFPGTLTEGGAIQPAVQSVHDGGYSHPMEPTADFGDTFTTSPKGLRGLGDGYFLQEANLTDKVLNGAPNGRATVAGDLVLDLVVAGSSTGVGTVPPAQLLNDYYLTANQVDAKATASLTLRNTKHLDAVVEGRATAHDPLEFGALGAWSAAVLADSPLLFARFEEPSGTAVLNDPSLGGATVGALSSAGLRAANQGMPNTAGGIGLRQNTYNTSNNPVTFNVGAGTIFDTTPQSYTVEFWAKITPDSGNEQILFWSSGPWSDLGTWLWVSVPTDGTLRVFRGGISGGSDGRGRVHINGDASYSSNFYIADSKAHLISVTFDMTSGVLNVYVDGVLIGTDTRTVDEGNDSGKTSTNWSFAQAPIMNWRGVIDELAFWRTALTQQQVATHYNAATFAAQIKATSSGKATTQAFLTFPGEEVEQLEGSSAGQATGSATELRLVGLYKKKVLEDSPFVYISKVDGGGYLPVYNDPAIGGERFGNSQADKGLASNVLSSLVETEASNSLKGRYEGSNGYNPTTPTVWANRSAESFTMEMWFRVTYEPPAGETSFTPLAEMYGQDTTNAYYTKAYLMLVPGGGIKAAHQYASPKAGGIDNTPMPAGSVITASSGRVNDGFPHHIAVTWDAAIGNGLLSLYIDGVLASAVSPALANTRTMAVVDSISFGQFNDTFTIDEPSVIASALSASRIEEHYLAGFYADHPMRGTAAGKATASLKAGQDRELVGLSAGSSFLQERQPLEALVVASSMIEADLQSLLIRSVSGASAGRASVTADDVRTRRPNELFEQYQKGTRAAFT